MTQRQELLTKHHFKITEAKHIQALSPRNQHIFLRMFYYKVKVILWEYMKPIEKHYRSYKYTDEGPWLRILFFERLWHAIDNYPFRSKMLDLISLIIAIPPLNQYALDIEEENIFQDIERLMNKVPSFYKDSLNSLKEEKIFIQLLLDIYNTYFTNEPIKDYSKTLDQKHLQQLAELNDLYQNPDKYLKAYLAPPRMLSRFFEESKKLDNKKEGVSKSHSAATTMIMMSAAAAATAHC